VAIVRLRVLELPTLPDLVDGSYRVPFVLILDDTGALSREYAEQFNVAARGVGAEGCIVLPSRVELERTDHDDWPHYTSTYCIHGRHGDCRLTCKVCSAPCQCSCHDTNPAAEPDPSRVNELGS
jgi:hypothetical protein